ncbi:MAG: BTAD domain-containing putative transcriptional regulator [Pseudomonadota bacterium]
MKQLFNPPTIFEAVQRQRLFTRLEEQFHKQFFLITGQAAQGKTTLVASFLEHKQIPVIWLPMSLDDQEHGKVFDKIMGALLATMDAHDEEKPSILSSSTVLGTDKGLLRHVEGLMALLSHLPCLIALVLDDFELIKEKSTGLELIQRIMQTDAVNLKLFILSRTQPEFNLAKLKMAQKICILQNEDLSFSLSETYEFFSGKTNISSEDLEKIHRITDGWAGGLALVSEALRHSNQSADNLPERLSAEAFNFFSQEIYSRLSEDIRHFLIQTSVLETIDIEVVGKIFDRNLAMDVLTRLEKRNLFIQRVESDTGSTAFKYHLLFKNFLLQNLIALKGRDEYKQLNQTIGQLFWEKRDHESALIYYQNAGLFYEMAKIIKIKGPDYMIRGNLSGLEKWISGLPDKMVEQDPWLLFFMTVTHRIKGGKKNISLFKEALNLFEKNQDIRGIMFSVGYLIEAAVFMRKPSKMILSWIQKGEAALLAVREKERYPWARGLLLQQIGLGYIAGSGNLPKGISACKNAIIMGRQINNPVLVINASITLAFGHVQAGDFANARKLLTRIKQMTGKEQSPEYRALKSIVDINFALKKGEFEEVSQLLTHSESDIEKFGLIFLYPGFVEAKALYLAHTGQFVEARQMAEHLNDFSILEGNDFYTGLSCRISAFCFFLQKKFSDAHLKIKSALIEFNPSQKGDIHYYLTQQLSGMIFFENKEFKTACDVLLPVLDYFEKISSELSCCETCFVLGMAHLKLGEEDTGIGFLQKGFEKAARETYLFFPLISEKTLVDVLLAQTIHHVDPPFWDHVLTLISKCRPAVVFDRMDQALAICPKKYKAQTIQRLIRVYKLFLPRLRIQTLGQFNIFLDDKRIDLKAFEGSKPIMLLKSIVLHGAIDIPKEILINDLWPDALAEAGEKNFKINLHRLRKVLEQNLKKEFKQGYVLQKSGLVSIDPDLVSIDAQLFMAFGIKAEKKEKQKLFDMALGLYEQACELYNGDFFVEEPYLEWIVRKRELYQGRYMELLGKKAFLHEELDQTDAAIKTWNLALDCDPCFETAYQNLMILHADAGRKKSALDLFETCRVLLEKELGIQPDQQTLSILSDIKGK